MTADDRNQRSDAVTFQAMTFRWQTADQIFGRVLEEGLGGFYVKADRPYVSVDDSLERLRMAGRIERRETPQGAVWRRRR